MREKARELHNRSDIPFGSLNSEQDLWFGNNLVKGYKCIKLSNLNNAIFTFAHR